MNSFLHIILTFLKIDTKNKKSYILGVIVPVLLLVFFNIIISTKYHSAAGTAVSTIAFIIPGVLAAVIGFSAFTSTAIFIANSKENGFFKYIFITPVSMTKLLVGINISTFITTVIRLIFVYLVALLAYKLKLEYSVENIVISLAATVVLIFNFIFLGTFLGNICRTISLTTVVAQICFIVMLIFSGLFFPFALISNTAAHVLLVSPASSFVYILRETLVYNNGTSPLLNYAEISLGVSTLVFLFLSVITFKNGNSGK